MQNPFELADLGHLGLGEKSDASGQQDAPFAH